QIATSACRFNLHKRVDYRPLANNNLRTAYGILNVSKGRDSCFWMNVDHALVRSSACVLGISGSVFTNTEHLPDLPPHSLPEPIDTQICIPQNEYREDKLFPPFPSQTSNFGERSPTEHAAHFPHRLGCFPRGMSRCFRSPRIEPRLICTRHSFHQNNRCHSHVIP